MFQKWSPTLNLFTLKSFVSPSSLLLLLVAAPLPHPSSPCLLSSSSLNLSPRAPSAPSPLRSFIRSLIHPLNHAWLHCDSLPALIPHLLWPSIPRSLAPQAQRHYSPHSQRSTPPLAPSPPVTPKYCVLSQAELESLYLGQSMFRDLIYMLKQVMYSMQIIGHNAALPN